MNWTMFLANVISLAEAGMPEIGEIIEMLENAQGLIEVITAVLAAIIGLISVVGTAIASILGIASTAFTVIFTVVVAVVAVLMFFLEYLGIAIPLFIIGRKVKCKFAWLAWVPVGQSLFAIFVMWKISGKEEFEFWNGKIRIRQGILAVLGYVIVSVFGNGIVTILVGVLNIIPGLGQVASLLAMLLYWIPGIVLGIIEYVYMRDVIRVFKSDDKKCQVHAFVIAVLDRLLIGGWARSIYLITLMGKKPLPKEQEISPDLVALES